MDWAADNIQAVIFLAPVPPDAWTAWFEMTGAAPQAFQQGLPSGPGATAVGFIDGRQVALVAQPGRFDLVLTPQPQQAPDRDFPGIVDLDEALKFLVANAKKILAKQTTVNRVALVFNLKKNVENDAVAVDLFRDETEIASIPNGSTDHVFNINIRKQISIGEATLTMNRVCKWSTGTSQLMQMQIVVGGALPMPMLSQETHVISLTIDINTLAQNQPFAPDVSAHILDALASEVAPILAEGYKSLARAS